MNGPLTLTLLPTVLLLGGLFGVLVLAKLDRQRAMRSSLVAYSLRFPRQLEVKDVQAFVSGLSGLLPPWWRRWLSCPYVSLEVHAQAERIEHYLLAPADWAAQVENLLQASAPSIRYQLVDPPVLRLQTGAEYRLSSFTRLLRVDADTLPAKLLSSLLPLQQGERVVVQWLISPHGPVRPAPAEAAAASTAIIRPPTTDPEAVSSLKAKHAHALLLAAPRIALAAPSQHRALALLRRIETVWHETRAPGVHFRRRLVPGRVMARKTCQRATPFAAWPVVANAEELAGLIGWPTSALSIPGVILGGCRLVAASPAVAKTGTIIADSIFPGNRRPLALTLDGRLRHVHLLGPTGTGKSTLMVNMAAQDMQDGLGLVLLDAKGDLVEEVLRRVPERRLDDVIVLDPADTERVVGMNPLKSASSDHAEVVVENLVGTMRSVYRYSWGPRLDDILRAVLMTLTRLVGATLCEVPLLLTDRSYRRRLIAKLDDPVGLESFWGWFEGLSGAERQTALGPVMNKIRSMTMRPRIRNIIGQSEPKLDLAAVLRDGKILLVSLATGLLGEEAAWLLGALLIAELWHATAARAALPPEQRRPVMAYLDEWQHFLHLPTSMGEVLAEARGLGLGMVLAHQELGQLPEETRRSVLANARSRVVFQLAAADAQLVAKELGGIFSADDLMGLGAYEVVAQLYGNGATQGPATARTRPLPEAISDPATIRARSREHFGVARADIEADIRSRQAHPQEAPIGQRPKRRQQG